VTKAGISHILGLLGKTKLNNNLITRLRLAKCDRRYPEEAGCDI